jgi:methionyl-tRNA formyltransferase
MINVAFFGTSDKSYPILETLNKDFNLELCVTRTDSKVGRKQKLKECGVKKWAKENDVDYICIDSITHDEKKVVGALKSHKIELGVVADFKFIIPKNILDLPEHGIINIHFSLLPKLRGASPVQHAILKGLDETGVTYYLMNEKMDQGDIIKQVVHKLDHTETTGTLYKTLFDLAANNLTSTIKDYVEGKIEPIKQDSKETTYCNSKTRPDTTYIFKDDARIDWNKEPDVIERQIRAFNPWPIAWTTLGELENNNKLYSQIQLKDSTYPKYRVKIIEAEKVNGQLRLNKLQVEGKNEIDWMSFMNGYTKRN